MRMSRFLILSEAGSGNGLALRLQAEGHDVTMWVRDLETNEVEECTSDIRNKYRSGCVTIADVNGFGVILDFLRDSGNLIFAGSGFADKLEADRGFAEDVMQQVKIETPASEHVDDWDDAAKIAENLAQKNGKVVLKPGGNLSGVVPSYVAADAEDAVAVLNHLKQQHGDKCEIDIQEFVEGIAISTEGWFNGHDWVEGMFNHTIERKNSLAGDIGPSGGCTGNVVWRCDSDDPIVEETLTKLTKVLREHLYVGPFDINCVVNEGAIYGLEFTPRFGYDAFPTLLYGLFEGDFGSFIDGCSRGDEPRDFALRDGFAAGIRLSLPPWPSKKAKAESNIPIRGISESDLDLFWPYGVRVEENELFSSGSGTIGVMNGIGDTIGESFARAYLAISKMKVSNLQYRNDLSGVIFHDYRKVLKILIGKDEGWIGVDLDGTLAKYTKYSDEVGEPIESMVRRVKRWVSSGKEVRIVTARVEPRSIQYEQAVKVHDWVKEHIGTGLEVTDRKDHEMSELYDDRAVTVVQNQGIIA